MLLPRYPAGETVTLTGVRPDGPWTFALPPVSLVLRVFLGEREHALAMVPDTVYLLPSARQVVVLARSSFVYQFVPQRRRRMRIALGAASPEPPVPTTIAEQRRSAAPSLPVIFDVGAELAFLPIETWVDNHPFTQGGVVVVGRPLDEAPLERHGERAQQPVHGLLLAAAALAHAPGELAGQQQPRQHGKRREANHHDGELSRTRSPSRETSSLADSSKSPRRARWLWAWASEVMRPPARIVTSSSASISSRRHPRRSGPRVDTAKAWLWISSSGPSGVSPRTAGQGRRGPRHDVVGLVGRGGHRRRGQDQLRNITPPHRSTPWRADQLSGSGR
jgi:hypothetical protein